MHHLWTVVCSSTSVDRVTNNVSLFNVLESIQITTPSQLDFPANVPFQATVVTTWTRDDPDVPATGEMRTRILGPDNQELISTPAIDIDLRTSLRARTIGGISGIRVAGPGTHCFEVSWREGETDPWAVAIKLPIEFSFVVEPSLQQHQANDTTALERKVE